MGFCVRELEGCKLITGEPEAEELAKLLTAWGADWVMDGELGRAVNGNVVVGPPKRVAQWRKSLGLEVKS